VTAVEVTERVPGPRTSTDPTRRQVWLAVRGPLAVLLLIVLVGVVAGYVKSREAHGRLDPRAYDPAGSRAIAELLRDQGVAVELARTTDQAVALADDQSTLLILGPSLLQKPQLAALADAATERVVLVEPTEDSLAALVPGITVAGTAAVETREPACDLPAARRAGAAETGGVLLEAEPGSGAELALCYSAGGDPSLVSSRTPEREVVVWGAADPLTNDRLDEDGNAALAMNLLGQERRLVWYLPMLGDALATERKSPYALMPSWWKWGFLQVAIAVLLLGLWRIRRLGPVVVEPLPVVVRAAETVEGRARLYRRAHARDRATDVLRAATRERLAPMVGLPATAPPPALVDAVAARVGRPAGEVGPLLYGSIPVDDATLVRLADDLDTLEREVRRS
jgi:Domain of unknown function (DUF4350)